MSDDATEWSGKIFGLSTGLAGALGVWLLSQSLRVCGVETYGPKTDFVVAWPFEPMSVSGGLFANSQYCASAIGGEAVAALPWIIGVVLAGGAYLIGDLSDKRKMAARTPHPG